MKKFLAALLVFVASVLASSSAHAIVDVDARYWFSNLDANVKATSGGVIGTDIDLANDLGLDDKKNFLEGRVTLELGSHKLRYGFMPLKWDGSKTITQTITFGGQTYSASTLVDSELNLDYHRLAYEYDIIDVLSNRLGVIFEVKYLNGEARLKSSAIDEVQKINAPIPTVGLSAQVGLPFLFSVGGEVTGIGIGKQAYLFDAEAAINIKPAPFVVISGGYRIMKLHLEKNDDKGDLTINGPFLNLRADF